MTTRQRPQKPHKAAEAARDQEVEQRRRERLALEVSDVRAQLETDHGRRVAYQWLHRAGLIFGELAESEDILNPTTVTMAAAVAKRTTAWRFDYVARLTCNDLWLQMLQENAPEKFTTLLTLNTVRARTAGREE